MKLIDRFMITWSGEAAHLPWKIYDKATGRKLSDNYGAERDDADYDNWPVWSMTIKTAKSGARYVRVSVVGPEC